MRRALLVLTLAFAFSITPNAHGSKADVSVEIDGCAKKLAMLTDAKLMSRDIAHRRARAICRHIRVKDPSFWKALRVLTDLDDPLRDISLD